MQNINFLEHQIDKLGAQQAQDKEFFKKAVLFFGAVFVIFSLTFAFNLYLNIRLNGLKKQIKSATQQIESSQKLEADYLFFVDKLKIIKELFDKRLKKQVAMDYFENLFPPEITITGLNYSMEDGVLSLNVISPHVFFLEQALEILEDPEVEKHFETLEKTKLNRTLNGEYSFTVTVTFTEDSELVIEEKEY